MGCVETNSAVSDEQVPVSYISESVYKTSVDWINHCSLEALGTFVLWLLDCILADLASQQVVSKGSKKGGQPASSKSQVYTFLPSTPLYSPKLAPLVFD